MDRHLERSSRSTIPPADIRGPLRPRDEEILSPEALEFLAELHARFAGDRREILVRRTRRQASFDSGKLPELLPETRSIRESEWTVAPAPKDLNDRRVEITGPVDRKMMINALNSGAKVFMADLEDSQSPTWAGLLDGQANLRDAVRRQLDFTSEQGKRYTLSDRPATLVVRPRGWHLDEEHLYFGGHAASGSLVDFGLYFFHNAEELIARGSGPYFYLAKLESHVEARLWNRIFEFAQERLGIPQGTIRATVLIETIVAAFEMDEILYELRDHAAGLNAGRWDYIFSMIKKFRNRPDFVMPDRADVSMAVPFMRAYAQLLVKTCHRRGAHAIGGMSAFIPSRKDAEINRVALAKVREDKNREAGDGFDGTWVAHPDLVPVAKEIFDRELGVMPHQKSVLREDYKGGGAELLAVKGTPGKITENGVRLNVGVALQYLDHWLQGTGAVAIHNLMEDAATAEISRAQLWQWIHHRSRTAEGKPVDAALYTAVREQELQRLGGPAHGRLKDAAALLDSLVLSADFQEFLTLPAYRRLIRTDGCS